MIVLDAVKAGALLLLAAVLEVSLVSDLEIGAAHPEVVLVLLVSLALLRGPVIGALGGFWAGLVVDTATLGTLGLTSLLLTVAGYLCGRFGDATTRASANPVLVAILLATLGVGTGSALLHFMLGETLPVSDFVAGVLVPSLALNLLVSYPMYWLARRLFPPVAKEHRPTELGALG